MINYHQNDIQDISFPPQIAHSCQFQPTSSIPETITVWFSVIIRLVLSLLELHINGIRQYIFLYLASFTHNVFAIHTCIVCFSTFKILELYSIIWIDHHLFIHSPADAWWAFLYTSLISGQVSIFIQKAKTHSLTSSDNGSYSLPELWFLFHLSNFLPFFRIKNTDATSQFFQFLAESLTSISKFKAFSDGAVVFQII